MKKTIYQLLFLLLSSQLVYSQNSNITISSTTGQMNSPNQQLHFIAGESVVYKGPTSNTQIKAGFHYTIPEAATEFTFFSDRDTLATGDTLSLAIRVANIPSTGIFSFDQIITFDTAKLAYVDYIAPTNSSFIGSLNHPTQIPFSYFTINNVLTDSTIVMTLRFINKMNHGENTTFSLVTSASTNVYDPQFAAVPYTEDFDTIFTINPAVISGKITTETGLPMPYVAVIPSNLNTKIDTTNMMGNYNITTTMNASLSISPQRNDDVVYQNGINSLDILTIIQHIAGNPTLSSPYKKIAANVSAAIHQDTTINSLDLGLIQQVILASRTNFGGEQYRFVPSTYTFPNGFHDFPDSIAYSQAQNLNNQDFIGIKLGDVTNDWNNNLRSVPSGPTITIGIDSSAVLTNEMYTHRITACGMQNISAYQMTITWDSTVAQLDSILPNNNWSVQSNPYNAGTATILFFEPSGQAINIPDGATLFSLQLRAIGNVGTSTAIEINSTITPLLVFDNNLNSLPVQTSNGIFEISSLSNLPIKLSTFEVKKGRQPLTAIIEWQTATEIDSDYFTIEWSHDGGLTFEEIALIAAQGNSNHRFDYRYLHSQPNIGDNYYRLKAVDQSGAVEYSVIKVLTFHSASSNNIDLFPNPFNNQLQIQFKLSTPQIVSLQLVNYLGQTVSKESVNGSEGENRFLWDLKEDQLPSGSYWLQISIDGQQQTQKLIKF